MEDGISEIVRRMQDSGGQPFLVAIDGRCGGGKTTLAARLEEEMDCPVIHMDHFFLRPEQRTDERLQEPGGNVDYERVGEEVLLPLRRGQAVSYRPFDCKRMALASPVQIKPGAVTVVEGSYSCHPALWDFYDLRIFLDIGPEAQIQRIRHRNGEDAAAVFRDRWIPLEERYFAAYGIQERCDLVFGEVMQKKGEV